MKAYTLLLLAIIAMSTVQANFFRSIRQLQTEEGAISPNEDVVNVEPVEVTPKPAEEVKKDEEPIVNKEVIEEKPSDSSSEVEVTPTAIDENKPIYDKEVIIENGDTPINSNEDNVSNNGGSINSNGDVAPDNSGDSSTSNSGSESTGDSGSGSAVNGGSSSISDDISTNNINSGNNNGQGSNNENGSSSSTTGEVTPVEEVLEGGPVENGSGEEVVVISYHEPAYCPNFESYLNYSNATIDNPQSPNCSALYRETYDYDITAISSTLEMMNVILK